MSELKKITLDGTEYTIPPLPFGVQREMWDITQRMSDRSIAAKIEGTPQALHSAMNSKENLEDALLMIAIAFAFISDGFNSKTFLQSIDAAREKILAMNTDRFELLSASITVAIQGGGKTLGEQMEAARQAMVPSPEQSQISTESSPTSA